MCRLGRPGHHGRPRHRTRKRRRCCHLQNGPLRRTRRPRSSWACSPQQHLALDPPQTRHHHWNSPWARESLVVGWRGCVWVHGPKLHAVLLQLGQICTKCALRHGGNSGLGQGTSILLLSVATCSSSLRCESLALGRGTGC